MLIIYILLEMISVKKNDNKRKSKSNLIMSLSNKYYIDVIYDRLTYVCHVM